MRRLWRGGRPRRRAEARIHEASASRAARFQQPPGPSRQRGQGKCQMGTGLASTRTLADTGRWAWHLVRLLFELLLKARRRKANGPCSTMCCWLWPNALQLSASPYGESFCGAGEGGREGRKASLQRETGATIPWFLVQMGHACSLRSKPQSQE